MGEMDINSFHSILLSGPHTLRQPELGIVLLGTGMETDTKSWGFSDGSNGKEFACNVGDPGSVPGLGRYPGEEVETTSVFLPGKFHGQKSLVGYSPGGCKEPDMTELLSLFLRH